jgi:hypothetical protein
MSGRLSSTGHTPRTLEPVQDLAKRGIIVVIGGGKGTRKYPSDITREEFEIIRTILESAKKVTKPRTKDLYDIFCAILYLIKSGCQWRMLPAEFPNWRIVLL